MFSANAQRGATSHVLKLQRTGDGSMFTLRAECATKHRGHVVTLRNTSKVPPMIVRNNSSERVQFTQQQAAKGRTNPVYHLMPNEEMDYALDNVVSEVDETLEFSLSSGAASSEGGNNLINLKETKPGSFKFTNVAGREAKIWISVFRDTSTGTKIVSLADSLGDVRLQHGLAPELPDEELYTDVAVSLAGIGISFVESRELSSREICYTSVQGIKGMFSLSSEYRKAYLVVEDMQLDCQSYDTKYDAVLYKTPKKDGGNPLLTLSYVDRVGQVAVQGRRSADSVEYTSARLMPLTVKVDGAFAVMCIRFFDGLHIVSAEDNADDFVPEEPKFYKSVILNPIHLYLTINNIGPLLRLTTSMLALRTLGVTLGNLNDVKVPFSSVELDKVFVSSHELTKAIRHKYEADNQQFLINVGFNAFGSMELLGDPLGSLKNISGGVKDLLYEPAKAIVKGPEEFGKALGRGASSFGTSIVGTVFGGVSKISGSVASGLAALSMDEDYQARRDKRQLARPTSFGSGLAKGLKHFGSGVADGVIGVVSQPVKGARSGGFFGAIKGVGKGVVGIVAKPTSGLVDMVSSSLAGIESEVSKEVVIPRKRPPRHMPHGIVTPYDTRSAEALAWIRETPALRERLHRFRYISHTTERINDKSFRVFLCLTKIFVVVTSKNGGSKVSIDQVVIHKRITQPRKIEKRGIELICGDQGCVLIPMTTPQGMDQFFIQIGQALSYGDTRPRSLIQDCACGFKPTGEVARQMSDRRRQTESKRASVSRSKASSAQREKVEVWENERAYPIIGFTKKLLPTDRGCFSSRDGKTSYPPLKRYGAQAGWAWEGDWKVDMTDEVADKNGWQYALDFPTTFKPKKSFSDCVRRRRHVRWRKTSPKDYMSK